MTRVSWYRDRAAVHFILLRYLPLLAALHFVWEWAHVPLYTIWSEADFGYIAFSVAHCTLGDVLIGASALLLALLIGREGSVAAWSRPRIAVLSAALGTAYTVFSEWVNVTVVRSWSYAAAMPKLTLGDFEIGLTPLAQWILIPPLTLYLAKRPGEPASDR